MAIKIKKKLAKSISYGNKRKKSTVKYIVIHYTGNKGDTASANANYFATSNNRLAGAHFFVDKKGEIWRSIPMNRIAWAVGGAKYPGTSGGKYYGKCTNANSVSIELCDLTDDPSKKQMTACHKLIKYIQKHCKNAKTIIRHWDVTGKACPASMTGTKNSRWEKLHSFLTSGKTKRKSN